MLKEIIKEILKEELTTKKVTETTAKTSHAFINQMVMVRTYSAGVHFGILESKNNQEVVLKNSRRVYSWKGAATLSQLSQEGSKNISDCKITMKTPSIILDQSIEVIKMSEAAIINLDECSEWKI